MIGPSRQLADDAPRQQMAEMPPELVVRSGHSGVVATLPEQLVKLARAHPEAPREAGAEGGRILLELLEQVHVDLRFAEKVDVVRNDLVVIQIIEDMSISLTVAEPIPVFKLDEGSQLHELAEVCEVPRYD